MKKVIMLSLVAAGIMFVGCGDKAKESAKEAQDATVDAAHKVVEATKEAAKDVADATTKAVEDTKAAISDAESKHEAKEDESK